MFRHQRVQCRSQAHISPLVEVIAMHAERVFLETDDFGNLKAVSKLPPRSRVEAIFLVLSEGEGAVLNQPHPALAGKG